MTQFRVWRGSVQGAADEDDEDEDYEDEDEL
jgi:hypothetical protein